MAIRLAAMFGIPLGMILLSPLIGFLGSPIAWIGGFVRRLLAAALLAQSAQVEPPQGVQQQPGRHDHAARQLAPRRFVVPAVGRDDRRAKRGRRCRPSSPASIREVNLGLPLDDALANLSRRVRSDDLDLMTTAIAIHHSVGGNLAEILDSIAFTIRERVRIKGEIKTLTAQQRM